MALRIVNNIAALNTQRWLGISDAGMKQSLERLSSGYRINKAADDAAGLAISQAFRANIASFKVASRNASEANALLQVAEGGMDQIGNMLTRLKELATQASSANVGSAERAKIDGEGEALLAEIDRIANSSKYGSTNLLDGTFGASKGSTLAVKSEVAGVGTANGIVNDDADNIKYMFSGAGSTELVVNGVGTGVDEDKTWCLGIISGAGATSHQLMLRDALAYSDATTTEYVTLGALTDTTATFTNLGVTITVSGGMSSAINFHASAAGVSGVNTKLTFVRTGISSINVENALTGVWTISDNGGSIKLTHSGGDVVEVESFVAGGNTITFGASNISFVLGTAYSAASDELDGLKITVSAGSSSGNTFQIGADNDAYNQISISVTGTRQADLGLTSLDLSTAANGQAALSLVDTAIGSLAGARGDIGASMNRLAYASANLATTIENQQAAESTIRDVDMATEMTDFTKNQILLQAGTAMLSQANMAPQQVLALFG